MLRIFVFATIAAFAAEPQYELSGRFTPEADAAVSLFGRWNWWLPELPARWLRVKPSLPPGTAAGEGEA